MFQDLLTVAAGDDATLFYPEFHAVAFTQGLFDGGESAPGIGDMKPGNQVIEIAMPRVVVSQWMSGGEPTV